MATTSRKNAIARACKVASCVITSSSIALAPSTAMALGWDISDEAKATGATNTTDSSAEAWGPIVHVVTQWAFGVAIVIFVLRVALTAIDRMFLSHSDARFRLSDIPIIGAYPDPSEQYTPEGASNDKNAGPQHAWTWGRIWKRFFIEVAIVAGAYAIVSVLLGVIMDMSHATGISSSSFSSANA